MIDSMRTRSLHPTCGTCTRHEVQKCSCPRLPARSSAPHGLQHQRCREARTDRKYNSSILADGSHSDDGKPTAWQALRSALQLVLQRPMVCAIGGASILMAIDLGRFLATVPPMNMKKWNSLTHPQEAVPDKPAGQVEAPTIIYDVNEAVVAVFTSDYVPLDEVRA